MVLNVRLPTLFGLPLCVLCLMLFPLIVAGQDAPAASTTAAADERRHAAGREVYTSLCQSCHQPDGEGVEGLTPSLVGAPLVLAPPEIGVRIVLHGKAGAGSMPPLGLVLNDDQIADALTFIRREWGNDAAAVAPALVTSVRSGTTSRTRPWTAAELTALVPPR